MGTRRLRVRHGAPAGVDGCSVYCAPGRAAEHPERAYDSSLVPRSHPRCAVSQKTVTQKHSRYGVNRPLARPLQHNAAFRKVGLFTALRFVPWADRVLRRALRVRGTARYVWRPCASAKPFGAP
jgi:hypothetical protein